MEENTVQNPKTELSVEDRELLHQLAEHQKTGVAQRRITMYIEILILILMAAALLIIGPKVVSLINNMEVTLNNLNALIDDAEPAAKEISKIDYKALNDSITSFQKSAKDFSEFTSGLSSIGGLFH